MAGCPYRNFEDCPQHNKKGGCELWMSYSGKGGVTGGQYGGMRPCADAHAPA